MNGAQILVKTLSQCGVELCFANPGTSELHIVDALGKSSMRSVLVLFEGVASGAADGYARIAGKPAAALFHLGPGFANAVANLHNARRAHVPLISIIGDHPAKHLKYDVPLTSDIDSLAKPVSGWLHRVKSPNTLSTNAANAVKASLENEGQIATLIVPSDCSWGNTDRDISALGTIKKNKVPGNRTRKIAKILAASGKESLLLMDGKALYGQSLDAIGRIAEKTGAALYSVAFPSRMERGAGRVEISRFPYFGEQITELLTSYKYLILVCTNRPATFFAYPGTSGNLVPESCSIEQFAFPQEDTTSALIDLANELDAHNSAALKQELLPQINQEHFDQYTAAVIAELIPEGAIVSDDSTTSTVALFEFSKGSKPHTWLSLTGGAIGQGLPVATGAAIASPDSKVICVSGDGSAMYTIQSLWTQARENLDIVTVIFSNRKYLILEFELGRLNLMDRDQKKFDLLDLSRPDLSFVDIAKGLGVNGTRAKTNKEFRKQFQNAVNHKGPHLIEVVL